MAECNVDDIICQIKALQSMRDLKTALGNETFNREFPELTGLDEKLINRIEATEGNIKEALAKCGNISLEEVPEVAELIEEE